MHKVRGNYGSDTRGAAKISPTAVEASGKGEDGSNPVEHRKCCVLEFDPLLKANVFLGRFFFHLTRFSSKLDSTGAVFPWVCGKHCETPWKPVPACLNTPSKKDSTDTFRGFQEVAGHLCVEKPPTLALRIGMKTLKKVLIEKVRTHPTLVSTLHLRSSISSTTLEMTRRIFFPHPSLVLYSSEPRP